MMDSHLQTHCIDPKLLRADAFDQFIKDREQHLLTLIAEATGHAIASAVDSTSPDEQEVPDNIAEDSGLLADAAA
jgi:hypothetical protein